MKAEPVAAAPHKQPAAPQPAETKRVSESTTKALAPSVPPTPTEKPKPTAARIESQQTVAARANPVPTPVPAATPVVAPLVSPAALSPAPSDTGTLVGKRGESSSDFGGRGRAEQFICTINSSAHIEDDRSHDDSP